MSDTEKLWSAVAAKFGDSREWSDLNDQQKQVFMQGINCFLAVLHRMV